MGFYTPPWRNSGRRADLPPNWLELRRQADVRNPEHICHECKLPGGEALDHIDGNPTNHDPSNLDWIHDWRSVRDGRSAVNCHSAKTRRQRPSVHRHEQHPAL